MSPAGRLDRRNDMPGGARLQFIRHGQAPRLPDSESGAAVNRTAREHIFISYRRDDARGASGRLYDWLRIAFGGGHVFRDVASIGIGKWRDKIDAALSRSGVCIAVIGPRWANADNLPRLHDESDMVRHELLRALGDADVTMVPALVENARVPAVASLPAELRPLFDTWNARPLREEGWEDDVRRLIGEIADATGLAAGPDIDTLIRAQQRVAELEQAQHLQSEQVTALRGTIDELTRKLAEAAPAERPGLATAFAELAQGRALAAEDAFEREYEAQARAAQEARRTMAEAARNVANLAMLRDVAKAVTFYRKALDVEPQRAETARLLGRALITTGDLRGAQQAFEQSRTTAAGQNDARGEVAARVGLGDVAVGLGDLATANAHFRAALSTSEQRSLAEPANTGWQRDISVNHDRIGDVLAAQGDGAGALAAYRKGLDIHESLSAHDPANTEWQRDLAVNHNKIGDVLAAQGDGARAFAAYSTSLDIAEALARRDPANTTWQRDLSVSYERIGAALVGQDDGAGALTAFRMSLAIRESLAARDPANTELQRDLSISHNKIGDVLHTQGDGPAAITAYRTGLAIRELLAARDPANAEWQRDLIVSNVKLAKATGDESFLKTALQIAEAMQGRGVLAPCDHWMIADLRQRLGATTGK